MKKVIVLITLCASLLSIAYPNEAKRIIEQRTKSRLQKEIMLIKQLPGAIKRCFQMRGACSSVDQEIISSGIKRITFVITFLSVTIPLSVHFYKKIISSVYPVQQQSSLSVVSQLAWAIKKYDKERLEQLLRLYRPTNQEFNGLLVMAISSNDSSLVEVLLNQQIPFSAYPQGFHPLLKLVILNRAGTNDRTSIENIKKILELLLERGVDPNMQFDEGWTALMYAAASNLDDIAQILVKRGAKKELKNNEKQTAHDIAIANNARNTAYIVSFIPKHE